MNLKQFIACLALTVVIIFSYRSAGKSLMGMQPGLPRDITTGVSLAIGAWLIYSVSRSLQTPKAE